MLQGEPKSLGLAGLGLGDGEGERAGGGGGGCGGAGGFVGAAAGQPAGACARLGAPVDAVADDNVIAEATHGGHGSALLPLHHRRHTALCNESANPCEGVFTWGVVWSLSRVSCGGASLSGSVPQGPILGPAGLWLLKAYFSPSAGGRDLMMGLCKWSLRGAGSWKVPLCLCLRILQLHDWRLGTL